MEETITEPE